MRSLAGKNVLITGGLGFIGSNLAIRLLSEGARVAVCDAMIEGYGGNLANVREVRTELEVHLSDVRDEEEMARLVEGRDVVFHLAAQVSHVLSLSNPYPDIDINIKGTAAVLEACRKQNREALVVRSGTRGQYGPAVTLPVSEETPADPRGIYEISQLSAEMICRTYTRIHGIRTVPLRLTNVYGPRQLIRHNRQGFIGWFIRLAIENREIQIFGDGSQMRDFVYVDDAADAFLRAGASDACDGDVFNVGGAEAISHRDLVTLLIDTAGSGRVRYVDWPPEKKRIDIGSFYSDSTKFQTRADWTPQVNLREGLSRTLTYFRAHLPEYVDATDERRPERP